MFSKAIVRTPPQSLIHGITTSTMGPPDYSLAMQQHRRYVAALESCGLQITVVETDESCPDCLFIEDVALVMPRCAIATRPGAISRRGEVAAVAGSLRAFYDTVETIQAPGTLDAGDIMMVGNHCYIGLSARTNENGAAQMIAYLQAYGYDGSTILISEALHLKSSVSYLEKNNLVVTGELCNKPEFAHFNQLQISGTERAAANCVWINDRVLVASGNPESTKMIAALGYQTIELDVSEIQKLDGGLSCMSLRF
jgi:dimethylargininase